MMPEMPDIPGLEMPEIPEMEFFDPYEDMEADYPIAPNPLEIIYGDHMPKVPPQMIPSFLTAPVPILVSSAGGGPPMVMMMPPGGGPLVPYVMPTVP